MTEKEQPQNYTWLDKKLNILKLKKDKGLLEKLIELDPEINIFREWTPLKLVCLSYFVGPYVRIINGLKETYPNLKIYYFDLFSGSGINKIKNRETYFAGSPILTIDCATNAKKYFDKMYFSDLNPQRIKALQKRIISMEQMDKYSWIKNRYQTVIGDANVALGKFVQMLKKEERAQYLAFIDPFRAEVKFKNLKKLLEFKFGDILFTLQVNSIARLTGKYVKNKPLKEETIRSIADFLDCPESEWEDLRLNKREEVRKHFIEKIKQYKKFVIEIPIRGKNFGYSMIYATRQEKPRWRNIITRMQDEVGKRTSENVTYSMDYLERKYHRVTDYFGTSKSQDAKENDL